MAAPTPTEYYLTGLRNQHAVEGQAVETIERELGRLEAYGPLHARMQQEITRSQAQAARLEALLAKHDAAVSSTKETVTSLVGKVSGVAHIASDDEVMKNLLAAIGFKAYEIASYKTLIEVAKLAGAPSDVTVLEQSMAEEQEMGDWLGEHLPEVVRQFLAKPA